MNAVVVWILLEAPLMASWYFTPQGQMFRATYDSTECW